jgi:hypothetical protein
MNKKEHINKILELVDISRTELERTVDFSVLRTLLNENIPEQLILSSVVDKLKDKKEITFEEWVDFEGHREYYNELVDNGFAYDIEKFYKIYIEAVKPSL